MTKPQALQLDRQVLAELREDLDDAFAGFVQTFMRNGRLTLAHIAEALESDQPEEVARLAHSLKGTAGYLGATGLSSRLENLQFMVNHSQMDHLAGEHARAVQEFAELEAQLVEILSHG